VIPHDASGADAQDGRVSSRQPISLDCELDSIDEPIRGRIGNRNGRSVEFRGWMELAMALADVAEDARSASSTAPQEENPS
jgi:hypothetical protein